MHILRRTEHRDVRAKSCLRHHLLVATSVPTGFTAYPTYISATEIVAVLADDYVFPSGYDDWHLPPVDEFSELISIGAIVPETGEGTNNYPRCL